jgi:hypothetical protein
MQPSVQQPISKDKNVMAQARKKLFKKQLFDLEVKGQGPTKVITVRDTPPYGHAPTYQISLTYLERQKCYGPDKKILFKKQLFDRMTIRRCVAYCNDLCGTLTFDLKVK